MSRLGILTILAMLLGGCLPRALDKNVITQSPISYRQVLLYHIWHHQLTDVSFWKYKPIERASAETDDEGKNIYIGSRSGYLHAFTRKGKLLWKYRTNGGIDSRPLFYKGILYFGSDDGNLYAADPATGKIHWKYHTKGELNTRPSAHGNLIFFQNNRETIYALNATTGAWAWHYKKPAMGRFTITGNSSPLIRKNRLFAGFSDGSVVALNLTDGTLLWTQQLGQNEGQFLDVDTTPVWHGGNIIVSSFSGGLYSLDATTGDRQWHKPMKAASTVAIKNALAYVTTADSQLIALNATTGKELWRRQVSTGVLSPPAIWGRHLFISSSRISWPHTRGALYVIDRFSGRILQKVDRGGGIAAPPIVINERVYFISNAGIFYAMRISSGRE